MLCEVVREMTIVERQAQLVRSVNCAGLSGLVMVHRDHAGGNEQLLQQYPEVTVVGM